MKKLFTILALFISASCFSQKIAKTIGECKPTTWIGSRYYQMVKDTLFVFSDKIEYLKINGHLFQIERLNRPVIDSQDTTEGHFEMHFHMEDSVYVKPIKKKLLNISGDGHVVMFKILDYNNKGLLFPNEQLIINGDTCIWLGIESKW